MKYIISLVTIILLIFSCSKSNIITDNYNNADTQLDSLGITLDAFGNYLDSLGNVVIIDSLGNITITGITLDSLGNYLDSLGNVVIIDSLGNVTIIDSIIYGCINPFACNYDSNADVDDGSCILPDGCTDPEALNYDLLALCDDGSCEYLFELCESANDLWQMDPICAEYTIPLIGETINIEERFDEEINVECNQNVLKIEFGDNSTVNANMIDSNGNFIIPTQEVIFDFSANSNIGFIPVDVSGNGNIMNNLGNINVTFSFELLPGVVDSTSCVIELSK